MSNAANNKNEHILAYAVGIAVGDGNLSNPNGRAVRLRVTCDVKYPKLVSKISNALQRCFPENKVSVIKKKKNSLDISCYSNKLEKLLGWKAPDGSKFQQNINIPHWILIDKRCLINCLCGLIETDGCIYLDRGYKMVMFTTIIPGLAKTVKSAIESLGFAPRIYKLNRQNSKYGLKKRTLYHIRISKDVERFLNLIKPEKC